MNASPYWAVAVAQGNREDLVATLLKREGFETYRPRYREGKRVASLFPGYLMVRVVLRWYPVRWCPGVQRLLMNGDHPARLADKIVEEIMSREVRGLVKLPEREPDKLEPGRAVRVRQGSFAGHIGIYDGMSGPDRERVLLSLMGQVVPVTMAIGNVERVTVV